MFLRAHWKRKKVEMFVGGVCDVRRTNFAISNLWGCICIRGKERRKQVKRRRRVAASHKRLIPTEGSTKKTLISS